MTTPAPTAAERLTSSRDVAATLRAARVSGRLVVLHHRSRGDGGPPRVTVVASRRVGTAVARNRAKRLLREAARQLVWPSGTDVVLVARPDCAGSELGAVAPDLQDLRDRVGWS